MIEHAFTNAWQSSKVPSIASACTLASGAVVIIRRCTSEMRPCGNSTTTSTWPRPRNASTAAPPVSPDVATTMVVRSDVCCSTWSISRATNCIARSLKASVGPWNSSSTNRLGAELDERRGGRMAEGAVGLARHAREIGFGNARADERPDHLDGDFGVRLAGKAGDGLGIERGPGLGHVKAAVAGKPASMTSTKSSAGASPRVET